MWRSFGKKADAKTLKDMDDIQQTHGRAIAVLESDMDELKEKKATWWLTPVIVIYQNVVARISVKQFILLAIAVMLAAIVSFGYWLTVGLGFERGREQDRRIVVEKDSIAHVYEMERMQLQIEMQRASTRQPTQITVEGGGTVRTPNDVDVWRSDSLPANFGMEDLLPDE